MMMHTEIATPTRSKKRLRSLEREENGACER